MSRFWSELSPEKITETTLPPFKNTQPITLVFGNTIELGPKKLIVHTVENSNELKQLHDNLLHVLNSLNVDYEYPDYIGQGHKPHVTKREGAQFNKGDVCMTEAAYLIEIVDGNRVVRSRCKLGADNR
jgi:hypothetical protein